MILDAIKCNKVCKSEERNSLKILKHKCQIQWIKNLPYCQVDQISWLFYFNKIN